SYLAWCGERSSSTPTKAWSERCRPTTGTSRPSKRPHYGPDGTGSAGAATVFGRILAGKKPQWTGRLDQPHTFHYLPDIARGLLVLADRRGAEGHGWALPAGGPP